MALSVSAKVQIASFEGMRSVARPAVAAKAAPVRAARGMSVRADAFIGSTPNLIVCGTTALFLAAGKFGLAPTVKKQASAGLKLTETENSGLLSGDPTGFTAVDVLALGSLAHIVAFGIILGTK